MGIVRRQSLLATASSYLGGALGFINKAVLFTRILNLEAGELGLVNLLMEISVLFGQFALLGIGNSILRFFPYFEDEKKGHHGILTFGLIVTAVGSLLSIGLLWFFQNIIVDWVEWKRGGDLLTEYYIYLFPLVGSMAASYLLTAFLRSRYKVSGPTFIREVLIRILVTLAVTAYALDWLDFRQFVLVYTAVNCSLALILVLYSTYLGELFLIPQDWKLIRQYARPMIKHGIFVILGGLSFMIVLKLDFFMLYTLMDENALKAVGIYTTIVYFTTVMEYPYRALMGITAPKVADMWKNDAIPEMERLYKRTSLLNFTIAIPLFFLIWINKENIFGSAGEIEGWVLNDPGFAAGISVFFYLGIARVFHMLTGLNATIIYTSKYYRYDLIFNIGLLVIAFILNLMLIPKYGMDGAAIATASSMILYNLIRVIFVYYINRIHPFSMAILGILMIGLLIYGIDMLIPFLYHPAIDLVVRSSIYGFLYALAVWKSGLVPDINNFVDMVLKQIRQRLFE